MNSYKVYFINLWLPLSGGKSRLSVGIVDVHLVRMPSAMVYLKSVFRDNSLKIRPKNPALIQ